MEDFAAMQRNLRALMRRFCFRPGARRLFVRKMQPYILKGHGARRMGEQTLEQGNRRRYTSRALGPGWGSLVRKNAGESTMSVADIEDYRPGEDEAFMNERQKEYFRKKLLN
jgi:hypothetical protein